MHIIAQSKPNFRLIRWVTNNFINFNYEMMYCPGVLKVFLTLLYIRGEMAERIYTIQKILVKFKGQLAGPDFSFIYRQRITCVINMIDFRFLIPGCYDHLYPIGMLIK